MSTVAHSSSRRAFTVIELSIVLVIIALVAGILIVGVRHALIGARLASERQFVTTLRMGVEQFKEQFKVLPPLVDDDTAITASPFEVPIAGFVLGDNQSVLKFLTLQSDADEPRYSERTLPLYLMGAGNKEIDGVEGMGFTAVERNGQFSKRGKPFEPYFAADREQTRIVTSGARGEDTKLYDKFLRPRGVPIRYYRWLPTYYDRNNVVAGSQVGDVKGHNVPFAVGDPASNGMLRDAEYAVISAGQNNAFGDEPIALLRQTLGAAAASLTDDQARDMARADNIVEVGK